MGTIIFLTVLGDMKFRQHRHANNVGYYSPWKFFVGVRWEYRSFLKFQNYAVINQIFISWQTENCVPTPDYTGGLNLFFWFIAVASRGKKKRDRERSRGRVGAREKKWKEEEENGKKRVGPRAAGLMSLIMEKYIKWHQLYFLRNISRSDSTHPARPLLLPFTIFIFFCVFPCSPFFINADRSLNFVRVLSLMAAKSRLCQRGIATIFRVYMIY